jgi:hypothetical protein
MPGFNGTGPQSAGPMTGWGRGCCMAYLNQARELEQRPGKGGCCRRNCYAPAGLPRQARWAPDRTITGAGYAPPSSSEVALEGLMEKLGTFEKFLGEIIRRLEELEKEENELA